MDHALGVARTRWMDWVGTAAADDAPALVGTRSLYDITGIDRDHWTIVAVDLHGGTRPSAAVYAARREQLGEQADPLEVTALQVVDPDQVAALLTEGFGQVSMRLAGPSARGRDLVVTDLFGLGPAEAELSPDS